MVVDHRHGRVWAHRVPNKGILGKAEWVPRRVSQDLSNGGIQNIKLHIKTDQEFSAINVQTAMQKTKFDRIIPPNSLVGESECNGRVENAIRRIQEKVRALRHHVEYQIKSQICVEAPVMSWLVRWAAELLSKYVVGEDGKTFYERIRQEDCVTPLVPFGEMVMYLQLKTVHRNKGTPAKRLGIWLGNSERTEDVLIGTKHGVVKCRTVSRLSEAERWSKNGILDMRGTLWQPIFGRYNQHIPVDIADNGDHMGFDSENEDVTTDVVDDETGEKEYTTNTDKFHVSQKAIKRSGTSTGCAACNAINERGGRPGRIGHHHSNECRKRMLEAMSSDPQYRHLIQRLRDSQADDGDQGKASLGNIHQDKTIDKEHTTTKRTFIQHISNVKKAIAHVKEKLQNEKDNMNRS